MHLHSQYLQFLKSTNITIFLGASAFRISGVFSVKDNTLIGYNCIIIDTSFHNIEVDKRKKTALIPQNVIIEKKYLFVRVLLS